MVMHGGAQRCSVRTIKFGTALTSILLTLRAPWPLATICLACSHEAHPLAPGANRIRTVGVEHRAPRLC